MVRERRNSIHHLLLSRQLTYPTRAIQATADTVDLGEPHVPKEESINVFKQIEHELKKTLVHLRHDHDSELSASSSHLPRSALRRLT